jgi:hypothetical protein
LHNACFICTEADCSAGDWLQGETCVSAPCAGACCYETENRPSCWDNSSQAYCSSLQGVWHPGVICGRIDNCITTTASPVTTVTVPPLLP